MYDISKNMNEKLLGLLLVLYLNLFSCNGIQQDYDIAMILRRLEMVEKKVEVLERENKNLRDENRRIMTILNKFDKPSDLKLSNNVNSASSLLNETANEARGKNIEFQASYNQMDSKRKGISRITLDKWKMSKRLLLETPSSAVTPSIAFYVGLKENINILGSHQAIDYNEVMLNDGNAYDPLHGHFTAPVKGMYLLSASIFIDPGKNTALEMVRNGQRIGVFYADARPGGFYSSQSRSFPIKLEQGDMVWLRTYPGYEDHSLPSSTPNFFYNSFAGVLLYTI